MAIQPIDLQTLYTQLDKIGKAQVQQQAAAQATRDTENASNKKEAAERLTTVQGAESGEERTGKVHERTERDREEPQEQDGGGKDKADKKDDPGEGAPQPQVIRDPNLGTHVDISG